MSEQYSLQLSVWAKRFIWLVGIVAMLSLTINDFIPLLDDYTDEGKNVLTQVSVIKDKPFPFPTLAVCLPYNSRALDRIEQWLRDWPESPPNASILDEYAAMINHSWNVWEADNYDDYFSGIPQGASKIMRKLLDAKDGFSAMKINDTSSYNWNLPIIDAVWDYFYQITTLDRELKAPYKPHFTFESLVDDAMRNMNFTLIGHVSNEVMEELLKRVHMALSPFDNTYDRSPSVPTTIFKNRLCVQTGPTNGTDESPIDGTTTYNFAYSIRGETPNGINDEDVSEFKTVWVYDDPSTLYSSWGNSIMSGVPEGRLYESNRKDVSVTTVKEDATLMYSVESRFIENRTGVSCSYEDTPETCMAKHHVDMTIQYCNCIPFTYRYLHDNPGNLSYCHVTHYQQCHHVLTNKSAERVDYCNQKCEYTFYRWKPTTSYTEVGFPMTKIFSLKIKPLNSTPYLEFVAVDKITIQQFFAQLGGSIGLYMGFSGLTIFAVIALSIDFLVKQYLKRRGTTSIDQNSKTWTMLWTKNFLYNLANRAGTDKKMNKEEIVKEVRAQLSDEFHEKFKKLNHQMNEQIENMSKEIRKKLDEELKQIIQISKETGKKVDLMKEEMNVIKGNVESMEEKINEIRKQG